MLWWLAHDGQQVKSLVVLLMLLFLEVVMVGAFPGLGMEQTKGYLEAILMKMFMKRTGLLCPLLKMN